MQYKAKSAKKYSVIVLNKTQMRASFDPYSNEVEWQDKCPLTMILEPIIGLLCEGTAGKQPQ